MVMMMVMVVGVLAWDITRIFLRCRGHRGNKSTAGL